MGVQHTVDPNEKKEEEKTVHTGPPDGGWGWMVVLGSFLCNVIVDGVCLSFGVVAEELAHEFNEPIEKVSWIGSILAGSYLTVGPVVSALALRFGCRKVTIYGGIIAAAAFVMSSFASGLNMLIITYGLLGGIGFGMIYLPSIVTVGYWFEKRRAFATGLVVCGTGLGTFVFAPLVRYLLDQYGWKGTNLIIAGIVLNCVVCGALFRPLDKIPRIKKTNRGMVQQGSIMKALIEEKKRQRTISNGSLDNCIITKDNRLIKLDPAFFEVNGKTHPAFARLRKSLGISAKSLNKSQKSLVNSPGVVILNANGGSPQLTKPISKLTVNGTLKPNLSPSSDSGCSTSLDNMLKAKSCDIIPKDDPWLKLSLENSLNTKSLSYQNVNQHAVSTSGLGASFISIQVAVPSVPSRSSLQQANNRYVRSNCSVSYGSHISNPGTTIVSGSVMSIPQYSVSVQSLDSDTGMDHNVSNRTVSVLKEMFNFRLLKSPMFDLLVIASVFSMLGFFVPFYYIGTKAAQIGIQPKEGAFLVSVIGITNTVGRVISGWVADRPWADPLVLNNGALIFAGLATLLCPLCTSFELLALYAAVFGLCIAVFVSLRSILLVHLLGLDNLTKSFGILILFQGAASIAGAPLAGQLLGATGNVDGTFYLAGSLILASGLICFPLRILKVWEEKQVEPLEEEMPMHTEETLKVELVETAI